MFDPFTVTLKEEGASRGSSGEKRRKKGAGQLGGPTAASATAATTISVLVAWKRRCESQAPAGGAAAGRSAVGNRWRI